MLHHVAQVVGVLASGGYTPTPIDTTGDLGTAVGQITADFGKGLAIAIGGAGVVMGARMAVGAGFKYLKKLGQRPA